MTRRTLAPVALGAGFLFNVPFGPRPVADAPNDLGGQMLERLQANHTETKGLITRPASASAPRRLPSAR